MIPRIAIRAIEWLLIALLAVMVVLVFGNVVLRYAFNSGIVFSEEVSRFVFMWLTLLGALVAMHDGAHLGMTSVIAKLPVWLDQAYTIPTVAEEQARFTAIKNSALTGSHGDGWQTERRRANIDFVIQCISAEVYVDYTVVD